MNDILIRGARTHNLKNIDVRIPRNSLTVITGLSGSGKSSLAFDTLYAEGQRRYVESLSAYARQFLSMMEQPDVDAISGLSPAISIEQKRTSHNPRSTVGTVTEIYDYLRLLFARVGEPRCPHHGVVLNAKTVSEMVDEVMKLPEETAAMILSPIVSDRKGEHRERLELLRTKGYVRVRLDGVLYQLDELPEIDPKKRHTIEVVVDRFRVREDIISRLSESFDNALTLSQGLAILAPMNDDFSEILFSSMYSCPHCGFSPGELEPKLFSFNNPKGACPTCDGLGVHQFFDEASVLSDTDLSLSEGAIIGWDKSHIYYFGLLQGLSKHYGFSLDVPFSSLPQEVRDLILYGSGDTVIDFTFADDHYPNRRHRFEGVVPNLERRYRETDSQEVREMLAASLSICPCKTCGGGRLSEAARHVFVGDYNLPALAAFSIDKAYDFFKHFSLTGAKGDIAVKINREIVERLGFLVDVGLDYLTLDRASETLSGGEAQRIRLASQIGSGLVGVMYVLDEPSIGLHQRDNERLLKTLFHLRDLGNTVIVVEHDEDTIRQADYVIDMGPMAGVHGGEVVATGAPSDVIMHPDSWTGKFLRGEEAIDVPPRMEKNEERMISLEGVTCNNLQNFSVDIPLGLFTCITGVSGSGKSSLINDTLYPLAANLLNRANLRVLGQYRSVKGLSHCDKVIDIDQSPIGRTPRSNAATYTGIFTAVRELFSSVPEARLRGYKPGRFSFNVKGGRCEACQGEGLIKVEMHFLPDVYVHCDVCQGKRYNRETLEILYRGKNIHEVLEMTVEEALEFFSAIPSIYRKCQTLNEVGLSYIRIGQSATTLSGGEAQRIKLSRELSKRDTGKTLYILDEPTTGLHFYDVRELLRVLFRLRDKGNTIVVIEHHLDVIKTADWIIDLGPEGGSRGGKLLIAGTPEEVAKEPSSHTGRFLAGLLAFFD